MKWSILPGAAYIGQHGKGGCRGSFRTRQDWWRRAAATKTLGRLSVLGDWEDGNWTKSEGNSFVSVKKGPGKRTDWRSLQDEGIRPWYLGKGGGVVIWCRADGARLASAREPGETPGAEAAEVWDQIRGTGEYERVRFEGQEWWAGDVRRKEELGKKRGVSSEVSRKLRLGQDCG